MRFIDSEKINTNNKLLLIEGDVVEEIFVDCIHLIIRVRRKGRERVECSEHVSLAHVLLDWKLFHTQYKYMYNNYDYVVMEICTP